MPAGARCWPWKPFCVTAAFGAAGAVPQDPLIPHLSVTGAFELHNLTELVAELNLPGPLRDWPDSRVLLHGYARWGCQLPEHLEGQFSFVIEDSRARVVFATVDHLASLPLLYRRDGDRLVLTGDMPTMLHTGNCPRELNAGALLTVAHFDRIPLDPGETLHKGIYCLPAGSCLVADSYRIEVRRYWRLSIRPELVPDSEPEIYEKARHLVETAVANRLRGKDRVAIMFSGGLDSSALAAAAATYLRSKGKTLLALGAINDPANSHIPDERAFMEKIRCFDNVELEFVDAAGRGPFDGSEDPTQFESCARLPVLGYLFRAIYAAAEARGADIVLNGGGGELGISGTPAAKFLEDAARFRWLRLARELRSASKVKGLSAARLFAGEVKSYYGRADAEPAFFLNPEFVRRSQCDYRPRKRNPVWPNSQKSQLQAIENLLDRGAIAATLPPEFVMGTSRPLRDKNLLEYCLAVPSRYKAGDGYGRLLLRKAFDPILPKDLAWRKGKIWASPDYESRSRAQVDRAAAFVTRINWSGDICQVIDRQKLTRSTLFPQENAQTMLETLNLTNFVVQFPRFGEAKTCQNKPDFAVASTL